jgi:uncharacterized membrane-anchored protein YitT (DUF2179 family)
MKKTKNQIIKAQIKPFVGIALGAFLAAVAIRIFLLHNYLIDGGIVGLSLIGARLLGNSYLSGLLILFNLPFIYLAYRYIRKSFVFHMFTAVLLFAFFLSILQNFAPFNGDALEIIVFGGAILGIGTGLVIRNGGCMDGTEISAILINRKLDFTVGQIVLFFNIFIFGLYGFLFNWHIALHSLMTYFIAFKMIDIVITGLDEVKSVLIITTKPKELKDLILQKLGLGLTIIPALGGFSGEKKEILFVIVERLDLAELKEIVLEEDPKAFMAIENLHEVAYGKQVSHVLQKTPRTKRFFFF